MTAWQTTVLAAAGALAWTALSIPAAIATGKRLRHARETAEDQAIALTKTPAPGPAAPTPPLAAPVPGHGGRDWRCPDCGAGARQSCRPDCPRYEEAPGAHA